MTTDINELKSAVDAFSAKGKEIDTFLKDGITRIEGIDAATKDAVKSIETHAKELQELGQRVKDAEQKLADSIDRGHAAASVDAGEQFARSEEVQQFLARKSKMASIEVKNTITSTDSTTAPDRQPGIIPGAFRALRIRDVLPSAITGLNVIETTKENTVTMAAAETAEGSAKPESAVTFALVTTPISTVATWLKISKQVAADAPTLANYINTRLLHMVERRVDSQLVNGDGTTPNISGITDTGNFTAHTPLTAYSALDSIAVAISAVATAEYSASAILLNPSDFWTIQRAKGATNDHYLYASPGGMLGQTIWGLPVVASNAVAAGKLIVADFTQAYQFWQRETATISISDSDSDNFTKNLLTVLAETRCALETRVPAACLYGNLTA